MTPPPTTLLTPPTQKTGNCACSSSSTNTADAIDAKMRERIEKHPCYSEEAHHHYARMHVAVAPACNIQCNYCNRKYDCANESRPGVVSELLTPEEAAHKVLVIAGKIPQMTVLGIAGPGDPLANPEKTFRTFELIADQAPDIKLCLSTNGLMLPEYVDRIKQLNIDHVTITINMVDPEIGTQIYPWVHYKRKRYRGLEAARILHERQMEGLQALKEADILCKVNSVMIPGINDQHLVEVNQVIREKGAFLHNIMPLISAPEHGTHFGLTGQRGPNPKELKAVQDSCSGNMKMMRHCRQCRADAVGLLGEDRSQEFTKDKFKEMAPEYNLETRREVHAGIEKFKAELKRAKAAVTAATPVVDSPKVLVAVATKGGGLVNQHFGHAKEFMIYEVDANEARFVGHRKIDHYCQSGYGEEATLDNIIQTIGDCKAVLVSKIGHCPQTELQKAGIQSVEAYDVIETVARAFYDQYLQTYQA
ncbi:nitrogenase cofactor biosynthesis protein NifB [Desertifilum sp. FACHB-1129]|uniref:FeMo cofactor biosynthesis protein NifB n=1 Tax=Desertifilum tharense IPPAS B-1220 TaxID=1781255 RepID=A0A1E5QES4_9CYAN|nr:MULTISPECIES: nitrogenase cofactor biosynthesis protein NifB [Desertifilum]MCD8485498.1 nitrogenase cofactor biosynthesis protein NifB [Desertifilum sp.]MDA0212682.1 nitrogenase cofactor biosynthesis protein NifB [Cyanobacteria bacterium FC1]MBD2313088.1 nitrogenase cofactor biosynthesis protein NifB [Desertifilum sp. FACHB-1129]MBD2324106.1 nitrogenase cofactor biosynthesis protein NifB [Desertifilum sp. FACHB-866]MBD2334041.1 nitrogenase cofactor biosynthesis protein NifB [Desertifilum sp